MRSTTLAGLLLVMAALGISGASSLHAAPPLTAAQPQYSQVKPQYSEAKPKIPTLLPLYKGPSVVCDVRAYDSQYGPDSEIPGSSTVTMVPGEPIYLRLWVRNQGGQPATILETRTVKVKGSSISPATCPPELGKWCDCLIVGQKAVLEPGGGNRCLYKLVSDLMYGDVTAAMQITYISPDGGTADQLDCSLTFHYKVKPPS